ncbi:hypothetical protein COB64_01765 [Candidatus Wolfebacteria bacterium]|nr:MAG: hypothetical protein COB64_01765 [Candidatus Wolfebacteria bacterium]
MIELFLFFIILVIGIVSTALWFQETHVIAPVSTLSLDKRIVSRKKMSQWTPRNHVLIEFLPVVHAHLMNTNVHAVLEKLGYRMLSEREKYIIRKQYSYESSFTNFIVVFPHKKGSNLHTSGISCIQWTENGVTYTSDASRHNIQCVMRMKKYILKDSLVNSFYVGVTRNKTTLWTTILDRTYDIKVALSALLIFIKNKAQKALTQRAFFYIPVIHLGHESRSRK